MPQFFYHEPPVLWPLSLSLPLLSFTLASRIREGRGCKPNALGGGRLEVGCMLCQLLEGCKDTLCCRCHLLLRKLFLRVREEHVLF